MKYNLLLCVLLFSIQFMLFSQEAQDVLTLSITEEPTTLHKGRVQGFLGYEFKANTHFFENNGYRSRIIDKGMASHDNQLSYSLKYGLTNYIQLNLANAYFAGFEGYQTYSKFYGIGKNYNYTSVKQTKGLQELTANVGFKLPIKSKIVEIAIFPGIRFPLGSHKPESPTYEINKIEEAYNYYNVDFISYEKAISGNYFFEIEGVGKLRLNKRLAFELKGMYVKPFSDVSSVEWHSVYDGNHYYYYETDLTINSGEQVNFYFQTLYVPDKKEIMGLKLGLGYFSNINGYAIKEGIRTYYGTSYLINAIAGLELVVTRHIRFNQTFWYDVAGQNNKGAFGLVSSFTFNFQRK
jgi:hypothetical protein